MAGAYARISLLSSESQARIGSSAHITSLTDVVLGLIKNSLDANAGHVDVRVDFLKGYCSVLDDGHGILDDEFLDGGTLGQLYCTSKDNTITHSYGRYGRFLASLSGVSLLSITSHHIGTGSSNLMVLKDGRRIMTNIGIQDEDLGTLKHGTKVVVHNLFGQMPVRVKHRTQRLKKRSELAKDFSDLKNSLVAIIIGASRPFSLEVRGNGNSYIHKPRSGSGRTDREALSLENIVSTLLSAGLIESSGLDSWRHASVHSEALSMSAAISIVPSPNKSIQFISLNQNPLLPDYSGMLFDQINAIFDASDFGVTHDQSFSGDDCYKLQNKHSVKQGTKNRKGIDRWPMFYVRIASENESMRVDDLTEQNVDESISSITGLLSALITEFLHMNDFRPYRPKKLKEGDKQPNFLERRSITPNFDYWSRIKAGNSVPEDLLSGLPFICRSGQTAETSDLTTHHDTVNENAEGSEDAIVSWVNPRTGNKLQINSRTGMILPSDHHVTLPLTDETVSRYRHRPRPLQDIAKSLKDYVPLARAAPRTKSITTCYFDQEFKSSIEGARLLDGATKLQINGPITVESASTNISKHDLKTATILGQVDKKFILASLESGNANRKCTLVLIDQHAADERVKVEQLFERLCTTGSVILPTPIIFEADQQEIQRFQDREAYFASWNIYYSVSGNQVRVIALPEVVAEKCRLEPRYIINLLRGQIWQNCTSLIRSTEEACWSSKLRGCPPGILDMVASRACRSAIMFNDKLTLKQCRELVERLCVCLFPFQCAHGRPSLTVLATLEDSGMTDEMETMHSTFGRGWKAWVN